MTDTELTDAIAAVAHACWVRRMRAAGWREGRPDVEWRTHDAICDYQQLSAFDRELIRDCVGFEELEERLADAADAALREREMSVADMRVGLPVRLDMRDAHGNDVGESPLGRVVSWEVVSPDTGRLGFIRVAWPDGEVVDYEATEKALVAAE